MAKNKHSNTLPKNTEVIQTTKTNISAYIPISSNNKL